LSKAGFSNLPGGLFQINAEAFCKHPSGTVTIPNRRCDIFACALSRHLFELPSGSPDGKIFFVIGREICFTREAFLSEIKEIL